LCLYQAVAILIPVQQQKHSQQIENMIKTFETKHGKTTVENINGKIFICDKFGSIGVSYLLGWTFETACEKVAAGLWRNL
jgi:S-adenosylmethionine hydrolase